MKRARLIVLLSLLAAGCGGGPAPRADEVPATGVEPRGAVGGDSAPAAPSSPALREDELERRLTAVGQALAQHDLAAASLALAAAESLGPKDPRVLLFRARLQLRNGKLQEARSAAIEASRAGSGDFAASEMVVRTSLLLREKGAAVRQAQRMAEAHPDDIRVQNLALYALIEAGKASSALRDARTLLRRDEVNTETMRNIGRAYLALGKLDTARYVLRRANDVADEPQTHRLLGEIYYRKGDLTRARAELEKAAEGLPEAPEVLNNLGLIASKMVDYASAEQAFSALTRRFPGLAFGHANLGYLYRLMSRPADAEKAYRRALDLDPSLADAYYNLGLLYFGAEIPGMSGVARFQAAIEALNRYRDLRRTRLDRKENEQLNRYIQEAKRMIEMLKQSHDSTEPATVEGGSEAAAPPGTPGTSTETGDGARSPTGGPTGTSDDDEKGDPR